LESDEFDAYSAHSLWPDGFFVPAG
jgi:uncharacterized protein YbdZ (MbtH family)